MLYQANEKGSERRAADDRFEEGSRARLGERWDAEVIRLMGRCSRHSLRRNDLCVGGSVCWRLCVLELCVLEALCVGGSV